MKIGRYVGANGTPSTGIVVGEHPNERVLDLLRASRHLGFDPDLASLDTILRGGEQALERASGIVEKSLRDGQPDWFLDLAKVEWLIPNRPDQCLCAGKNFGKHLAEANRSWEARGARPSGAPEIPMGFIKLSSTLVPHGAEVSRPPDTKTLDYEVEVAAVIGRRIERIGEAKALDAVFGYTVFNDLSDREWQFREMENRMVLVGKNFPGAGPYGPWILTADEVPDPQTLHLRLSVNGELRQESDCREMIYSFAELIAFWSRLVLEPGDAIASGTPSGVAHAHRPDPSEWYLKPGDVIDAEVPEIGVLTTKVV